MFSQVFSFFFFSMLVATSLAAPGVLLGAPVAAPLAVGAPVVTATSSQVVARNYNAAFAVPAVVPAAPVVAAAPFVKAAPFVPAPALASPFVAAPAFAAPAFAAPGLAAPYSAYPYYL